MVKYGIVKIGGKQYTVRQGREIYVDRIDQEVGKEITLETLATFTDEGMIDLGKPVLKEGVTGKIIEQLKGEKIRVARFKAKVRYRRVRGFRPQLTKVQIIKI